MKKKLFLSMFVIIGVLVLTGCEVNLNINNNENSGSNVNDKKLDHKVYKYMKISSSIGGNLLYTVSSLFGDTSEVSSDDVIDAF